MKTLLTYKQVVQTRYLVVQMQDTLSQSQIWWAKIPNPS